MVHIRYEKKFLSGTLSLPDAETFILNHNFHFREVFSKRTINNIYFDSPAFNSFYDHINGVYERYKIRIRWYGSLFGSTDKPALEIKSKTGYAGKKTTFPLTSFKFHKGALMDWKDYFKKTDIPPEVLDKLLFFSPVLVNSYERKYYVSADNLFRITIDTRLVYYGINSLNMGSFVIHDPASVIIEMKYASADENKAGGLSEGIPVPLAKSSKYVRGMKLIYAFLNV